MKTGGFDDAVSNVNSAFVTENNRRFVTKLEANEQANFTAWQVIFHLPVALGGLRRMRKAIAWCYGIAIRGSSKLASG